MTVVAEWRNAYKGRRVLVTGHTGFKGGWLSLWLAKLGAKVVGFSLPPVEPPCLFSAARVGEHLTHIEGNVCDFAHLRAVWQATRPEIVFHLAAQPLVRESYRNPIATVQTNVLGTSHVLETGRVEGRPVAVVFITSDKCYAENEQCNGYRESDRLGGPDLYSATKAAAELLIDSYRRSFFPPEQLTQHGVAIASVRAGNVIGGGDWSADRLVPDCIRSLVAGQPIQVRSPQAVRPWQHVLAPLSGYLALGARLLAHSPSAAATFCEAWNFGPPPQHSKSVRDLVDSLISCWGSGKWNSDIPPSQWYETPLLYLSSEKARDRLGWFPRWNFAETIRATVDWYRAFYQGKDMTRVCVQQIAHYMEAITNGSE
jgi:CDP-glucose 4,6-dehydratase